MVPIESEDEVLPQDVIEELDRLTDGKAIISTEVGQHQMWAAQYYNFKCQEALLQAADLVQWATALAQEWAQRWATLTEL